MLMNVAYTESSTLDRTLDLFSMNFLLVFFFLLLYLIVHYAEFALHTDTANKTEKDDETNQKGTKKQNESCRSDGC
jgi:hypothetical protein